MKSKTKTILIFAAILAAAFLIAFLDGGAVQSAADEEEEGTLIGAFVSEEDIDIGGDLAVSAAGKFVEYHDLRRTRCAAGEGRYRR